MIELLAPAKNLECGIAAIEAGADALYIGSTFSARVAAGNSLDDIHKLVAYAHTFRVKVYVALNTLLADEELEEAKGLIWQLYELGVDAIIIQDMGLLELDLPPIPLIASTQCDNRSVEKVRFLEQCGFQRVILARELTLGEISAIRAQTSVALEFFVHGALCTCYSGQCYMSFAIGGRSANRGVCAQPCRKKYLLLDSHDTVLAEDYLLSLKDLNLSDYLEALIDAGITSLKIEGRLKDKEYVVNVVAEYRQKLDSILQKKGLSRPSLGVSTTTFTPNAAKSFNRGFTTFNVTGARDNIMAHTSKSVGEKIGVVEAVRNAWVSLPGHNLNTGDGVCYFIDGELVGTQIVTVDGDAVEFNIDDGIMEGDVVYRNFDRLFEKQLTDKAVSRKIPLLFTYTNGLCTYTDPDGLSATVQLTGDIPQNLERAQATIIEQFSKLGETEFVIASAVFTGAPVFIPIKQLNQIRRNLILELQAVRALNYIRPGYVLTKTKYPYPLQVLDYHGNVHNAQARAFYERHGVTQIWPAAESVGYLSQGDVVMTTKHCIRGALGYCLQKPEGAQVAEPLFIVDDKNQKFKLRFNCPTCTMQIIRD